MIFQNLHSILAILEAPFLNTFLAPEAQQTITLKFKYFDSKCGFDYLKVYDGLSRKILLGVFSGNTLPTNLFSNTSGVSIHYCL